VSDELVIFGCDNDRVYALKRDSGQEIWQFKVKGMVESSPVVVGDRVFFGSRDRHVYAVALATGREMGQWNADSWVTADPLPAGESLLVATREGKLVKLN
jgi:outer membrane protein assembly factor BamB